MKTILDAANAWIQYNGVDFRGNKIKFVNMKTASTTGGLIELRLDKVDGPLLSRREIGKTTGWEVVHSKLIKIPSGVHNIVVVLKGKHNVEIDRISFE